MAFRFGTLLLALILLAGCMDMFDPAGGKYARDRYTDPNAFALVRKESVDGTERSVFAAVKPSGKPRLRSVYLFNYLPPEKSNGPKLKYRYGFDGILTVAVTREQIARYSGFVIFGDYDEPTSAIPGAKSVNISQEVFFAK